MRNILVKYAVKLMPQAFRDLDKIEEYLAFELKEPKVAQPLLAKFEEAILSLEIFPQRGGLRHRRKYAAKGYRQIFVKNYTVVYRINEEKKWVLIITIKYFSRML